MGVGCWYPASRTALSASADSPSSSNVRVSVAAACSTSVVCVAMGSIVAHQGRAPGTFPGLVLLLVPVLLPAPYCAGTLPAPYRGAASSTKRGALRPAHRSARRSSPPRPSWRPPKRPLPQHFYLQFNSLSDLALASVSHLVQKRCDELMCLGGPLLVRDMTRVHLVNGRARNA